MNESQTITFSQLEECTNELMHSENDEDFDLFIELLERATFHTSDDVSAALGIIWLLCLSQLDVNDRSLREEICSIVGKLIVDAQIFLQLQNENMLNHYENNIPTIQ